MLQASHQFLAVKQTERALAIIDQVQGHLGELAPAIQPQLGKLLRSACLVELELGRFAEACELHDRASRHEAPAPDFAMEMARATENLEATPPDRVLQVFLDWLSTRVEAVAVLDKSPVAEAAKRFLFIDEFTPDDVEDLDSPATMD